MASDFPTEDDMNKMRQQHLKDEFSRTKESIAARQEDFKRQLREARGEQPQTQSLNGFKPANENEDQPQQKAGINNSHNSGQGQQSEKPKDKEVQKQKFKDMMREARGEQITKTEKQFDANSKDVAGDKQKQKETAHKVNGKDITENKDRKDRPGKYKPQPPTPGKDFTRTFGRDRD